MTKWEPVMKPFRGFPVEDGWDLVSPHCEKGVLEPYDLTGASAFKCLYCRYIVSRIEAESYIGKQAVNKES